MKGLQVPSITCGIVCHNESQNLKRCIQSLMQKENESLITHVLIVDNASTDNSVEVLRELSKVFPKIKFHLSSVNQVGGARQWIVDHCKTELLLFTDADCTVPENWVSRLLEAFLRLKDRGKIGGVCGPNRLPENFIWQKSINRFLDSRWGHGFSPQAYRPKEIHKANHLPTTNALFSVSALRSTQGFEPSLMVGEDVAMGKQLRSTGHELWLVPEPIVTNDCATSLGEWTQRMRRFGSSRWSHSPRASLGILGGLVFGFSVLLYSAGLSLVMWFAPGFLLFSIVMKLSQSWMEKKEFMSQELNPLGSQKRISLLCGAMTLHSYFLGWILQPFRLFRTL